MTVCIAAICGGTSIFGASDRMITSGDIEFEPELDSLVNPPLPPPLNLQYCTNTKIFPLTNSIVALTAGDSGLQSEILQNVNSVIAKMLKDQQPVRWFSIGEVLDIYVRLYNDAKAKRVRDSIYAPFGLNERTFIEGQAKMSKEFISEITKQVQRFDSYFCDAHGVETIITGIDETGAHIYSVIKSTRGDSITCCDAIGFAAIGSGGRHAESQFMMSGHNKFSEFPETLFLTYLAKKRSEVAPGVGKGTDMFAIGPQPGTFAMLRNIPDFDMRKLESLHKTVERGQKNAFKKAKAETKAYIENMFKAREQRQQQQPKSQPAIEANVSETPANG